MDWKYINQDAKLVAEGNIDWNKLQNKKVLVVGATGYVPQYFVHGLLMHNDLFQTNIKVIAFCRNTQKAEERFGRYYGRADFQLQIGDVREPMVCQEDVDYIINAASPAGVKASLEDPITTYNVNVLGNKNCLELALSKHAKYLFISSVDVYGNMENTDRLEEFKLGNIDILNVRTVYACAKRAAESLCACYANAGMDCKIVRPSQIMGGGIALNDGRLHIDFISQMLKGDSIVLKGDGTPKRTFIYVTDAILGMLTVLLEGKSGEAYNVCSETGEATVLELAKIMSGCIKNRKIGIEFNMETRMTDPGVKQVVSCVCGSSQKLRELGWESQISLEESAKKMMRYYGLEV